MSEYLLQLLWVLVGGYIIKAVAKKQTVMVLGRREERWSVSSALALMIPIILWAGFRDRWFSDTNAYVREFIGRPDTFSELPAYLETVTKDKGFAVFSCLIKILITDNYRVYLLIIAAIQGLILALVFRKYSSDYWLSVFLFIAATDYISWMFNGIRQFIAVVIVLAGTKWLLEKRYIPYIILVLFASLFHQTALIMIPIAFIVRGKAWNGKTILFIVLSVIAVFFVDKFTNILDNMLSETQYQNVVSDWQSWNDDGTNFLRVLVYSVPAILAFIGRKRIIADDDPVITMATNASLITAGIYLVSMVTSGIFIGRLPIYVSLYSNCILLPWEIENVFARSTSQLLKLLLIVCYIGFFMYAMGLI